MTTTTDNRKPVPAWLLREASKGPSDPMPESWRHAAPTAVAIARVVRAARERTGDQTLAIRMHGGRATVVRIVRRGDTADERRLAGPCTVAEAVRIVAGL